MSRLVYSSRDFFVWEDISAIVVITFLFPNKKVTKEIGIGEALVPRSRASNTPPPMYISHGALGIRKAT